MERTAEIIRKTNETDISLWLDVDGTGETQIDTGIGFFDHMLMLFAKHGLFDIKLKAIGDLYVDAHHTVEDVGIVLGLGIKKALGEKKSLARYGTAYVPMDETLAVVSLDLSGRQYIVFNASFKSDKIGQLDTELIEEFFRALAFNAGITLHINVLYGNNSHHIAEAIFKAFARALDQATQIDERVVGVMSTKGSLSD